VFLHWYRRLPHRSPTPAARRRPRYRTRLERLEDRLTPTLYQWTGAVGPLWGFNENWLDENLDNHSPYGDSDAVLLFDEIGQSSISTHHIADATTIKAMYIETNGYLINADPGASVLRVDDLVSAENYAGTSTIALPMMLGDRYGENRFYTGDQETNLVVSGPLTAASSGTLLSKMGPGTLQLSGDNSAYSGLIGVNEGTLQLGAANSLRTDQPIVVLEGGTLDLNDFDATLDLTEMLGELRLGSGTLTMRGHIETVRGTIVGSGGLTLTNNARLTLEGTDNYSGPTRIMSGTLEVDANSPDSTVVLEPNTRLAGNGTTGPLMVRGIVEPGDVPGEGGIGPGVLHSGDASFLAGSAFAARLDGPDPGGQHGYDQLEVNGTLDLTASPSLELTRGFSAADGETFTIIHCTGGVRGTFAGLPDNATFGINGQEFRINYTADGVILTRSHQLNPPVAYPVGEPGAVSQAVGDFDGDGITDVIVSTPGFGNHLFLFKGIGDGTFQPAVQLNLPAFPSQSGGVVAAQTRAGGPLDLLVTFSDRIAVLLGNGDGTFQDPQYYQIGPGVGSLDTGHFRGADQPLDLAVVSDDHVNILLGNGDGTFGDPTSFPLAAGFALNIAVGDIDGDGNPDIVTSHFNGQLSVLKGNGDGTFQPPILLAHGIDRRYGLILADLRGVGHLDIVTTDYSGYGVDVWLGNGDGTFQPPQYFGAGPMVTGVLAADFTNDGKLDLIVANYNGLAVLYGNGDGSFRDPVQYDVPVATRQMQVADFNSDGFPDVSLVLYSGSLDVFLNVGTGSMGPARGAGKSAAASHFPPAPAAVPAVGRDTGSFPLNADEDLLSGGLAMYDTDSALTSWRQVGNDGSWTDDYFTLAANLTAGNDVPLLKATTLTSNDGGNTMNGNGAWALISSDDNLTGFAPNSFSVPLEAASSTALTTGADGPGNEI
jgi:autotransporter-associated beta strand protein